jgi:hypothetical protein
MTLCSIAIVSGRAKCPIYKPFQLKTLTSPVASLYPKGVSKAELVKLFQQLQSTGKVIFHENKVTYAL